MRQTVEILGKKVLVEWSAAADRAMEVLDSPLRVEMELYFSCLIRKKVRFGEQARSERFVAVTPRLLVSFRPVMTQACQVSTTDEAPLDDFPIKKPQAFVPRKLSIDHRAGKWVGEYTI